jgi:hypothetical protein
MELEIGETISEIYDNEGNMDIDFSEASVINDNNISDRENDINIENSENMRKYSKNYRIICEEFERIEQENNDIKEDEIVDRCSNMENIRYYMRKADKKKKDVLKAAYKTGEYYQKKIEDRLGRKKKGHQEFKYGIMLRKFTDFRKYTYIYGIIFRIFTKFRKHT